VGLEEGLAGGCLEVGDVEVARAAGGGGGEPFDLRFRRAVEAAGEGELLFGVAEDDDFAFAGFAAGEAVAFGVEALHPDGFGAFEFFAADFEAAFVACETDVEVATLRVDGDPLGLFGGDFGLEGGGEEFAGRAGALELWTSGSPTKRT